MASSSIDCLDRLVDRAQRLVVFLNELVDVVFEFLLFPDQTGQNVISVFLIEAYQLRIAFLHGVHEFFRPGHQLCKLFLNLIDFLRSSLLRVRDGQPIARRLFLVSTSAVRSSGTTCKRFAFRESKLGPVYNFLFDFAVLLVLLSKHLAQLRWGHRETVVLPAQESGYLYL